MLTTIVDVFIRMGSGEMFTEEHGACETLLELTQSPSHFAGISSLAVVHILTLQHLIISFPHHPPSFTSD